MSIFNNLSLVFLSVAAATMYESASSFALPAKAPLTERSEMILLAKNGGEKAKKPAKDKNQKGVREKNIVREAQMNKGSKNIDFDAVDISGERKTPFGSVIDQNKSNKDFDLIKIRLRWHPEMIQSTASLETGKSN